jgi:hypothetical protein
MKYNIKSYQYITLKHGTSQRKQKQNPNNRHKMLTKVQIQNLLIQLKENNHKDTEKGIRIKI